MRSYFIQLLAIVRLCSYFIGSIKLIGGEKKHKPNALAASALIKAKTLIIRNILNSIYCAVLVFRSTLGLPTSC